MHESCKEIELHVSNKAGEAPAMNRELIGQTLKRLRESKFAQTMEELGSAVGVSASLISKIERGKSVRDEFLIKVAEGLGAEVELVLTAPGLGKEAIEPPPEAVQIGHDLNQMRPEERETLRALIAVWRDLPEAHKIGLGAQIRELLYRYGKEDRNRAIS